MKRSVPLWTSEDDQPVRARSAVAARKEPDGFIDFHGYSETLEGWLFGGWISAAADFTIDRAAVAVDGEALIADCLFATYPRADVEGMGVGLLGLVPGSESNQPRFEHLYVDIEGGRRLQRALTAQQIDELELVKLTRELLKMSPDGPATEFGAVVSRPIYEGVDTIHRLSRPVFLGIDEVVIAPSAGVAVVGWFLDPGDAVKSVRVRTRGAASPCLKESWLRTERLDIKEAYQSRFGLDHAGWGFHAFAALPVIDESELYLEVTLHDGSRAFKPLPAPTRTGRAGIVRLLSDVYLPPDRIQSACSETLGPAIVAINRASFDESLVIDEVVLGELPDRPRCSLIVPLYGRLDFLMYQMALMSEHDMSADEIIYILDEPQRKVEFLALARSAHNRFNVPVRLVMPSRNLGFAGASNAGLQASSGRYICFLNSDVMPQEPDWLDSLTAALEADLSIGIIGGKLLFEDGTVQHAGMALRTLPDFGHMYFPYHPGKGRLSPQGDGVRFVPLITGACMLMPRPLAMELGGFDTDYVVGDFEDADLCMKVRMRGLACAVHDGAVLYHLERQSQGKAVNSWRQNLTTVNAWTFAQRWQNVLDGPLKEQFWTGENAQAGAA